MTRAKAKIEKKAVENQSAPNLEIKCKLNSRTANKKPEAVQRKRSKKEDGVNSGDIPKAAKSTSAPVKSSSKAPFRDESQPKYWLVKSEPETRLENGIDMKFSIDDCAAAGSCGAEWDGVRNYQARNNLWSMRVGDAVLFYHSNVTKNTALGPGFAGCCRVSANPHPDSSQFKPRDAHYDPSSKKDDPKWWCPDIAFVRKFNRVVSLAELKKRKEKDSLVAGMALFTQSRLSVQPMTKEEYDHIVALSESSS